MRSTLGRLARAAIGAIVLLATLAVLPTLLIVVQSAVAWDWPALLAQPLSPLGAVAAGIAVGWAIWLALLWQVLADTMAALRGRHQTAPWLPIPVHTAITAVAGAVLLAVHTARGGSPAPPPTGPPTATALLDTDQRPPSDPHPSPSVSDTLADAGVRLAGGWLPLPVAGAVAAAITLAVTQTRRHYIPRPPAGWRRHDPDLPPLTDAATRILRSAGNGTVSEDDDLALADPAGDDPHPAPATPPASLDLLPDGDLHLTGPGRYHAARGLLVALCAIADQPPRIVLTAGTAETLLNLPHSPIDLHRTAADTRTGGQPSADVVVFSSGLDRPASSTGAGPPPSADQASRPAATAARTTWRTVYVDAPPDAAARWHISADGIVRTISGQPPRHERMPVLDQHTTRQLLTSLGLLPSPNHPDPRIRTAPVEHTEHETTKPTNWPDAPPSAAGMPRRLLIRVLGVVTVLRPHPDGTRSPVPIRRTASQQILLLLILHRGGRTDDELKEALWPDVPGKAAQRSYQTSLSELHRTLHDAAGRPVIVHDDPPDPSTGRTSRRRRIDPAAVQVDLWHLQGLLDAAATATDPAYRKVLLDTAARTTTGELATGWSFPWLLEQRERTIRRLIDVHTDLADHAPDHRTALRLLQQALQLAPTNEHLHRRVLQRHAEAGDQDGLRRAIATLTEHLTAHDLRPEQETAKLITDLLT
ncbi:AfsR/SARP family transcriptional regulator [Dactylosporangium matsuzakiense]|uniref:Bacterial transcriptional activator domain-containing protein n=1 Tax=Dactylosporangium matsuzakiense TaxID=53360 RepID=A0A9W6NTA7_9ACTN|nr:hypothetical protein [Dactylosporangium matsuzakiense]GLL08022.1 hypothetical protein GCM10017581_097820 [Dactylosporangium matsuzakiense]